MTATKERARLREAIEEQTRAQQAVDEARRAAANAQSRWSDANSKVGALTAEIEEAEDTPSSSDRFIADLAGGLDVMVKSPITELRKALENAEHETSVWYAGRVTAEQAVEARMHALDLARHRVAEAAQRVVGAEIDVTALIASAEAARQKVLIESAELMTVMRMLPMASVGRQAIQSFLQQPWCAPIAIERASGGEAFSAWFNVLKTDADAAMK